MTHKTMTQAQATARAHQILHDTAAVLSPNPRLDFDPSLGNVPDQCLANVPDASKMINVNANAWLRDIPASKNSSVARQVLGYWKKLHYNIQAVTGFDDNRPDISGETKDGFLVSLSWSQGGALSIGTTSPCIYPDGHPPP